MFRHRDNVTHVNVPCTGADLNGFFFAHVNHRDEHMVGIRVLFDGKDLSDNDVLYFRAQILDSLDLRAGDGHSLGKISVVFIDFNKLIEPFS